MMRSCRRLSVDGGAIGQQQVDELYDQMILQQGFCNENIDNVPIQVWEHEPWQATEDSQDTGVRTACLRL